MPNTLNSIQMLIFKLLAKAVQCTSQRLQLHNMLLKYSVEYNKQTNLLSCWILEVLGDLDQKFFYE